MTVGETTTSRLALLLVAAVPSFLAGALIVRPSTPISERERQESAFDLILPAPALRPDEVVSLQIDALRRSRANPMSVAQCYAFASPSNRALTGPLPRFAGVVFGPKFRPLTECVSYRVGEPHVQQGHATVMATLVGADKQMHAFRFFLVRQASPPYVDCWMTELVVNATALAEQTPALTGNFSGVRQFAYVGDGPKMDRSPAPPALEDGA